MQKLRENYSDQVIKHINDLENIRKKYGENAIFVNFDEVPLYFDMCRDYTYHFKGEKQVSLISHNASKNRAYVYQLVQKVNVYHH